MNICRVSVVGLCLDIVGTFWLLKSFLSIEGKYRIFSFNDSTINEFCVFSPDINSIIGKRDDNGYKGADTVDLMVENLLKMSLVEVLIIGI